MARTFSMTFPKTRSQSAGCTARVTMSVGSWRILRNSMPAMASAFFAKRATLGASAGSREAAGDASSATDVTEVTPIVERVARVVRERVVERRVGLARAGLELGGRSERGDLALVHDGDAVAERVRL